jgi:cytochrome c6
MFRKENKMKRDQLAVLALAAALAFGTATAASAQENTAALYKSKCQMCHGADGKGDTPAGKQLGAKDLRSPEITKMSDTELFDITKNGKEKMPGFDKKLTDDQIKALIKYIRSLK